MGVHFNTTGKGTALAGMGGHNLKLVNYRPMQPVQLLWINKNNELLKTKLPSLIASN